MNLYIVQITKSEQRWLYPVAIHLYGKLNCTSHFVVPVEISKLLIFTTRFNYRIFQITYVLGSVATCVLSLKFNDVIVPLKSRTWYW